MIIPQKLLGDCREELPKLAEKSVQLCVTSPPYHGMRSYLPKKHPWKSKEIGSEPTVQLYLEHLLEAFRAVHRVLRDDGTLWVNMGDRYTSGGRKTYDPERLSMSGFVNPAAGVDRPADPDGLGRKDLCLMPVRVAMALQADGWILRSMCPWIKRNTLPESVEDRPATAIEYWFMFSKQEDYYYDRDAVTIGASKNTHPRAAVFPHRDMRDMDRGRRRKVPTPKASQNTDGARANADFESHLDYLVTRRNRRNSDWFMESWQGMLLDDEGDPMAFVVNPKGTNIEHFASYPPKLVEPIILSCTSEQGCCAQCGAPRRRLVEKGEPDREHQKACGGDDLGIYHGEARKDYNGHGVQNASEVKSRILAGMVERKTVGWEATCKCEAPNKPCTVLDNFSGTGCTAMVATNLGRNSVSCELNPESFKQSEVRDAQGGLALL